MFKNSNKNKSNEDKLYSKILLLSRNKSFYTKFYLKDTFQNRINLIFIHISFLFIKMNKNKNNKLYKEHSQKMFDFVFDKIEQNMREIGNSDTMVNKNMKYLIKSFYNILIICESYNQKSPKDKKLFLTKYLDQNNAKNNTDNVSLIDYFDKYQAFCFDLSTDSVLRGELNFNYN